MWAGELSKQGGGAVRIGKHGEEPLASRKGGGCPPPRPILQFQKIFKLGCHGRLGRAVDSAEISGQAGAMDRGEFVQAER